MGPSEPVKPTASGLTLNLSLQSAMSKSALFVKVAVM